ncbi:MAG: hypothetical protein ACI88G_001511 [Woeseiaceae bacterium]|jgi:hypothetical protein
MTQKNTRIEGSCHCGNISFTLLWPESAANIIIRKCGCTFCQKRDGSWTSHTSAELVAEIDDLSLVSKYRFGTKTADFYVCSVCGLVPFVVSEIEDKQFAVVNVSSFDNVDSSSLSSAATNFDGEDSNSRLERRQRNWIPNVLISATAA